LPIFSKGDYSYGIYLYGFPVQQVVFALVPGYGPGLNFLLAAPLIVGMAAISWHGVEAPILRLRRNFSFVAQQRLALAEAETGVHPVTAEA
jgi:peptidoglycan/LPS O-acetylase OafA/YrhL